jgi:hypothetical protein
LAAFEFRHILRDFSTAKTPQQARSWAFAQILGKLYFFALLENLPLILLDYAQKPSCPANVAFKAPC